MRIRKLHIRNYKSLLDFKLENLNPFCAFVGPNASGKSNIFEVLEFSNYAFKYSFSAPNSFGGKQNMYSFKPIKIEGYEFPHGGQTFYYEFSDGIIIDFFLSFHPDNEKTISDVGSMGSGVSKIGNLNQLDPFDIRDLNKRKRFISSLTNSGLQYDNDFEQFVDRFSRIFIGNPNLIRRYGSPQLFSNSLSSDASNLSQILGKILENKNTRSDFVDWLQLLIPEFKNLEVRKSNLDASYDFFIYEKGSSKPFPRYLISDGTYNIIALMAAVLQSSNPQFLCIEEPENGLHPQAIQVLIDFFREKCEMHGHHIWINTHSPSLVRCLNIEEIILINKVHGRTMAKQLTKDDKIDIKTDEAWLTNALGGGVLWSK